MDNRKTPEYVRRAIQKYNEKMRDDENYKQKRREYSRQYYYNKKAKKEMMSDSD